MKSKSALPCVLILESKPSSRSTQSTSKNTSLQKTLDEFEIPWLTFPLNELKEFQKKRNSISSNWNSIFLIIAFDLKAADAAHKIWPILPIILLTQPKNHFKIALNALLKREEELRIFNYPITLLALGEAGETNAALFAASILALTHPSIARKLQKQRNEQTLKVMKTRLENVKKKMNK